MGIWNAAGADDNNFFVRPVERSVEELSLCDWASEALDSRDDSLKGLLQILVISEVRRQFQSELALIARLVITQSPAKCGVDGLLGRW